MNPVLWYCIWLVGRERNWLVGWLVGKGRSRLDVLGRLVGWECNWLVGLVGRERTGLVELGRSWATVGWLCWNWLDGLGRLIGREWNWLVG